MFIFPLGEKEGTKWTILLASPLSTFERYHKGHGFFMAALDE